MEVTPIALLGFGNVGRAFAELLIAKREELIQRYDLEVRVVGIMTAHHGAAINPQGIDLAEACRAASQGQDLGYLSLLPQPEDGVAFARSSGAAVLFENTPVDYLSGQPAVDHLRAALEAGMHVVTANKGPIVHAYHALRELAAAQGKRFLFEATVMDGAPIFSLWREALPAAHLQSFRGILNSTTNLILGLMEQGLAFEEALARAQAMGIAESDPSGDIEGWDAAVKVAALATVLMDQPLTPAEVDRTGIQGINRSEISRAASRGARWKLICQAARTADGLQASVQPEAVRAEDPLYHVHGTSSAITFQSDVLNALTIIESNPGPDTTAYGLLADLLRAVRPDQFIG